MWQKFKVHDSREDSLQERGKKYKDNVGSVGKNETWLVDWIIESRLITKPQLYKRIYLFLGNTHLNIYGKGYMIQAIYSQMVQNKKECIIYGEREREHKHKW